MWNWLVDNKEWLFSGGGVVIAVLIIRFIFQRLRKSKLNVPSLEKESLAAVIEGPRAKAPEIKKDIEVGHLSARAIITNIEEAPFLQQPDILKNYIGLRVTWEGYLTGAFKISDTLIRLHIRTCEKEEWRGVGVIVNIDPSQYPGLGLLKYEHPIRVSGAISEIHSYFSLKDAQIEYELNSLNK